MVLILVYMLLFLLDNFGQKMNNHSSIIWSSFCFLKHGLYENKSSLFDNDSIYSYVFWNLSFSFNFKIDSANAESAPLVFVDSGLIFQM